MNYSKWIGARVIHKPTGKKFTADQAWVDSHCFRLRSDGLGWLPVEECRRLVPKKKKDVAVLIAALEWIYKEWSVTDYSCYKRACELHQEKAKDALKKYRGEV